MIYTHVLNRGPGAVRSPADFLAKGSGGRPWIAIRRCASPPSLYSGASQSNAAPGEHLMSHNRVLLRGFPTCGTRSLSVIYGRGSQGDTRYTEPSKYR